MIRIILCEGETDLTLLGLYLEKMCGWIYERKPKLRIKIPQTFPAGNEKAETYKRGIEELIICCVGGKDKFGSFFEKYIHRIIVSSHDGETDFRIAVLTDADNRNMVDVQADILTQLSPDITNIQNNVWKLNTVKNSFDEQTNIEFVGWCFPKRLLKGLEVP